MIAYLLQVVGLAALAVGLWWVSPAVSLIVVGVLVVVIGALMEHDNRRTAREGVDRGAG